MGVRNVYVHSLSGDCLFTGYALLSSQASTSKITGDGLSPDGI